MRLGKFLIIDLLIGPKRVGLMKGSLLEEFGRSSFFKRIFRGGKGYG